MTGRCLIVRDADGAWRAVGAEDAVPPGWTALVQVRCSTAQARLHAAELNRLEGACEPLAAEKLIASIRH